MENATQPHEEFRRFVPYNPGIAVKIVKDIREDVSVSSGKAQSTSIFGTEITLSYTNRGESTDILEAPRILGF